MMDAATSPELLEREASLRDAALAIEAARRGTGRTVLVSGEAGMGKSALLRQIVRGLDSRIRVLRGGCEDLFSPRPLGPLRDIALSVRGGLQKAFDDAAPAARLFSTFFDVLNTPVVCSVVVFEDVHWADEATLDLIKYLGRRVAAMPVALFLSYRDDEVGPDHPLRRVLGDLPSATTLRLTLQALSPSAVADLAAQAGQPAAGLHEATGGNPFFLTEVLGSSTAWAGSGVPASVRDAVLARLARLAPAQREVLDALCVVPGAVPPWLLSRLLAPAALSAVDGCVERGVLAMRDGQIEFRHVLARLTTAEALGPVQRQQRHAHVLAALADPPPGQPPPLLSQRVHHAAEAGDASQVLLLAPSAAREAARVGAHRQAAEQLGAALRFAAGASLEQQAQLHESWSYEAGLSLIDQTVIEARHRAVELWRQLGRTDKVGHNLRWLSRLYWYHGDSLRAGDYADQAVAALEPLPAGPELAWAYSVRSQLHMLQDHTEAAIEWGERAIALAERLDEPEIHCHALNNVGTAELFAGRDGGHDRLERSLRIALAAGFHEQAARVYTNASEHAVVFKDHARAERLLHDGLAFDRAHDLDAWTHYLEGWLAQLRLEQGRLDEAASIAGGVLARPRLTAVMRLPALTVLARVAVRRGDAEVLRSLPSTLALAQGTGEAQRIVPVVLAQVEQAWLSADLAACRQALQTLDGLGGVASNPWQAGEVAVWRHRAGLPAGAMGPLARPWQFEVEGDLLGAADAWHALKAPHEEALCLTRWPLDDARASTTAALRRALDLFEGIGARPGAARVRALARESGLSAALRGSQRGPYAAARTHPHGLTSREQQMLALMAQGLRNSDIADRLGLARRTVEHHVTGVLVKLAVEDRGAAVALARREGWLDAP